jgi:hypothetical protein
MIGAGNFFLHHRVQTGFGSHPASYAMGTRGYFPGGENGRGVKLTTHSYLVPMSKNVWSYTSTPNTPPCRGAQLNNYIMYYVFMLYYII